MKTFSILTVSIIGFLLIIIGLSSDIAELTGYNVVNIIMETAPSSYIILFLIIVILYLITYIKLIRNREINNSDSQNESSLDVIPKEKVLSASDIAILDQLFNAFSGSIMHNFFEFLAETRSIIISQVTDFDEAIKLFLSPHKRLRNQKLEKAKVEFLREFQEFLLHSTHFDSHNGVTARFKANSDSEEDKYLKMVNNIYKQWSDLLYTVAEEAPNYHIKD